MAYTRIHPIKTTLHKALAYIENPDKTEGYLYISSFNCTAEYASLDFAMTAELAKSVNGDYDKTGGDNILAHHMIQSFSYDDNITPEKAHELGRKWADEILQGKYEYVITTHVDKGHIHNHIIFNATSFYDFHKFKNYKIAYHLRNVSDRLCEEYGLSVIRNPNLKSKSPSKYEMQHRAAGTSWKAQVQQSIDNAILATNNYESFKEALLKDGIEIFEGKRITFHKIGVVSQNGRAAKVRGDRIGNDYTKERILERLTEPKNINKENQSAKEAAPSADQLDKKLAPASYDKLIKWQARQTTLAATKELAAALFTIRNEGITEYGDFADRISDLQAKSMKVKDSIKEIDSKNMQYKNAAKYLVAYNKYLPVYNELQKRVFDRKKFESKHVGELTEFKFAAEQLEKLGVNPAVDPNKVLNLVTDQDQKVSDLAKQLENVDKRIDSIRKAQDIIKQVQAGNQEPDRQQLKHSRNEEIG